MKEFKNALLQGPSIIRLDESELPYVLFTSDLHLKHKNILHFTKRMSFPGVEDINTMEQVFADNINDAIYERMARMSGEPGVNINEFILFNCGDVVFASSSNSYRIMSEFRSKLAPVKCYNVFGNHETNNLLRGCVVQPPSINDVLYEKFNGELVMPWYWNTMYIVEVWRGSQVVMVFTVSHFPLHDFYGCINIHGHHHQPPMLDDFKASCDYDWAVSLREKGCYQDCGMDRGEGKPMWLTDILDGKYDLDPSKVRQLASLKWKYDRFWEGAE